MQVKIDLEGRGLSDHALISTELRTGWWQKTLPPTIKRKSEAERAFLKDLVEGVSGVPVETDSILGVQRTCDAILAAVQTAWDTHATSPRVTSRSNHWWNDQCKLALTTLKAHRTHEARAAFKRAVKKAKQQHYDERIDAACEKGKRVWDVVAWTKPRSLPMYKSLMHEGRPLVELEELWEAVNRTYNSAAQRQVDMSLLDELPQLERRDCPPISMQELHDAVANTSSRSAPGADHLRWPYVKALVKHPVCGESLRRLFNACIDLAYWPAQFKEAVSVVIPKSKKDDYSRLKSYRPIVLLSCLGKLCEKVLAARLHYEGQKWGAFHPAQFGGTKQHSTVDAGMLLVHRIRQGWARGLDTSVLAFDVAQFYPSVNHRMLLGILDKQGFSEKLIRFFGHYLSGRSTTYRWDTFTSPAFEAVDVGVVQGSSLSPPLANLYIAPVIYRLCPVDQNGAGGHPWLQFFVDDGLWSVSRSTIEGNVQVLQEKYQHTISEFDRIGLRVEHEKTEACHFTRKKQSPPLDLGEAPFTGDTPLQPVPVLRHLGFYLDQRLTFRHHVRFYGSRAASTAQSLLMLGNSVRGMPPMQRRRLYQSCVLPLMTYGCQLWYRRKGTKWHIEFLRKAQNTAARWITGAFRTSPAGGAEVLAGLPPVRLHIEKLVNRTGLRANTLMALHPLLAALPNPWVCNHLAPDVAFPMGSGPDSKDNPLVAIDFAGRVCTENFVPLHAEAHPGARVIDEFGDRLTWHTEHPKKDSEELAEWVDKSLMPRLSAAINDRRAVTIFCDGSLFPKPRCRTGAAFHAYRAGRLLTRRGIACGRGTSYDAEMMAGGMGVAFATRQACDTIHVVADNESALKTILDPSMHGQQLVSVVACKNVRAWLTKDNKRRIEFHWCPSHEGVEWNERVDEDAKKAAELPLECDECSLAHARHLLTVQLKADWREEYRQSPAYRGQQFLRLKDFESPNHLTSPALKAHGGSRSTMARFCRAVLNHAPLGSFRQRFFPGERTNCPECGVLQDRAHVLLKCGRYRRWWNCRGEFEFLQRISAYRDLNSFITANESAFTFVDAPD